MSESMYLPEGERDGILRDLAPILGFDFWTLPEDVKEDAAKEIAYLLTPLREGTEEEKTRADGLEEDFKSWRARVGEIFSVSLRKGVQYGKKIKQEDKSEEEILDDLESERDALCSWKDAYLGLREDLHELAGVKDESSPDKSGSGEDARETETIVETLQARIGDAVALRKVLGIAHVFSSDQVLSAIEALRSRALRDDLDAPRLSLAPCEALGISTDATEAQIQAAIEALRNARKRLYELESLNDRRGKDVENAEERERRAIEALERGGEVSREALDIARIREQDAVERARRLEPLNEALRAQLTAIRAENNDLRKRVEIPEPETGIAREILELQVSLQAKDQVIAKLEAQIFNEILGPAPVDPQIETLRAEKDELRSETETSRRVTGVDPCLLRALGLPENALSTQVMARIESLLRAERDLEADFVAKGALL